MKIEIYSDKYIVYLNNDLIKNINFKVKKEVEDCFRKVFIKIKKRLNKELNGFFNIQVYLNNKFGAIVSIEKEDIEYYEYLSNQIDMQIKIDDKTSILKEYDDVFNINSEYAYYYDNKYYVDYIDIDNPEFYNIVYGEKANYIKLKSKKLPLKKICDIIPKYLKH